MLPGADSLLPEDHVLDLFVPITDFHGYEREIRGRLRGALPAFEKGLHADLLDFLELCGPGLKDDVLTRYLGFPFWDMLVFPIQSVSDVGERDHVEAYRRSPNDTLVKLLLDVRGHPPTLATAGAASAVEPVVAGDELAAECAPAYGAILAEEGPALNYAGPLVEKLQEIVDGLAGAAG